jgi:hypothetical protein
VRCSRWRSGKHESTEVPPISCEVPPISWAQRTRAALPETILAAGRGNDDPDRRIITMLSARQNAHLNDTRCSKTAVNEGLRQESRVISVT